MVLTAQNNENTEKCNFIIEVARMRLGLYGYEKTTMQEIADDAGLSKASLYYYFPDKDHLIKAVIEKEQNEFLENLQQCLAGVADDEARLYLYVKLRHDYYKNLLNLNKLRFNDLKHLKPFLSDTFKGFKQKEADRLTMILMQGKENGKFHIEDIEKTAILFLDVLHGLRFVVVQGKEFLSLNEDDYHLIIQKQSEYLELFIKGLKYNPLSPIN